VLSIEGAEPNLKATVAFESAGTKQLLLKFARLTLLDE
jgi:DNA helicase-2/ATP-dependent DNA helicase PcrA